MVVDSARPLDVFSPSEAGEDGSASPPPPPPPLFVSGLGQGNLVGSGTLQLGLPSGPAVAPDFSRFQVTDASGASLDVSSLFSFDAAANLFSMDLSALHSASLPGLLELSANLVSPDYEFAQNYSFPLLVPSTRILGQLVDAEGTPLGGPAIAALGIGIVGMTSDVRRVVPSASRNSVASCQLFRRFATLSPRSSKRSSICSAGCSAGHASPATFWRRRPGDEPAHR
ncbi:MAG: hypothetical protein RL685_2312 [Pseudomonadota bacterium]